MSIELSNLSPAEGSVKSDNFRRGRDTVQETARQLVRATRVRKLVQEHRDLALKAFRCLYTEEFPREALIAPATRKSWELTYLHSTDSKMAQS